MPSSSNLATYPDAMLDSLIAAEVHGQHIIPHENPRALRLYYYGFLSALRKNGKADLANGISFGVQKNPLALIVRRKSLSPHAIAIENSLKPPKGENPILDTLLDEESIDSLFSRLKEKV